jgi:hypothetical protein
MKWTWTIRDLLGAMLMIAIIAAWYWNHQHGHKEFKLWLPAVLSVPLVPVIFYHFARRRQVIVLIAGLVCTCIGARFWWLIAHGQFK